MGDGIGCFRNGERIGLKKKILELAHVAIPANVFASITERKTRASSLLLRGGFGEKMKPFFFYPGNDLFWDAMVHHLEETVFFAGFDDQFRQL